MRPIGIRHVGFSSTLVATGMLHAGIVAYRWGFTQNGTPIEQTSFVLVHEGMLLSQPVGFPEKQRGWWYCDLIRLESTPDRITFRDLYVDVIVGPPGHPYRILDLGEYADALARGEMSTQEAVDGLRHCQAFLDRRLNRRHDTTRSWPEFPPTALAAFATIELPRGWRWETTAD